MCYSFRIISVYYTHFGLCIVFCQFSKENNQLAKSSIIKEGDKQSETLFIQMIDQAKSKGEIDSIVDSLALSMILQSLNIYRVLGPLQK